MLNKQTLVNARIHQKGAAFLIAHYKYNYGFEGPKTHCSTLKLHPDCIQVQRFGNGGDGMLCCAIMHLLSVLSPQLNRPVLCKDQGRRFFDEGVDINRRLDLNFVPATQWPKCNSLSKSLCFTEQRSDERTLLCHRWETIKPDFANRRRSCEYSNH